MPWPQSNDTVRQIGGWRAYAKEAQDAPPAGERASPRESAAPPAGHGKH